MIVEGNAPLAAAYAANIIAIYQAYRWNAYVEAHRQDPKVWHGLVDNDSWQNDYLTGDDLAEIQFWLGIASAGRGRHHDAAPPARAGASAGSRRCATGPRRHATRPPRRERSRRQKQGGQAKKPAKKAAQKARRRRKRRRPPRKRQPKRRSRRRNRQRSRRRNQPRRSAEISSRRLRCARRQAPPSDLTAAPAVSARPIDPCGRGPQHP